MGDWPDPEEDEDSSDENPWGFVPLDGGKFFVRQSEIVGLKWVPDWDDDIHQTTWHLEVMIENVGRIHIYGEDCANVMRTLGLPDSPPSK